jgi:hypothetical protein
LFRLALELGIPTCRTLFESKWRRDTLPQHSRTAGIGGFTAVHHPKPVIQGMIDGE